MTPCSADYSFCFYKAFCPCIHGYFPLVTCKLSAVLQPNISELFFHSLGSNTKILPSLRAEQMISLMYTSLTPWILLHPSLASLVSMVIKLFGSQTLNMTLGHVWFYSDSVLHMAIQFCLVVAAKWLVVIFFDTLLWGLWYLPHGGYLSITGSQSFDLDR